MISIVFITCNRQEELKAAVLSCLGKSDEAIEIIVVDNHSTDETRSMVTDLCKRNVIPLKFIFNTNNKGVSESRNQGYEVARGDIVFFLDDDAILVTGENCIGDTAAFMRSHPQYGVIATEIYNVRDKRLQLGAFPKKSSSVKGEVFNFIGASHFINKGALKLPTLYPNEFVYGGEELYLSLLIRKNGFQILYCNNILVHHLPSANTRMSMEDILIKNYSNAYNVKRYFAPALFLPVIGTVMIIRMVLFSKLKPGIIRKMVAQSKKSYNSQYRNPMSVGKFLEDIRTFGTRTVL